MLQAHRQQTAWSPSKVAERVIARFQNLPRKPAGQLPPLGEEMVHAIRPLSELLQKLNEPQAARRVDEPAARAPDVPAEQPLEMVPVAVQEEPAPQITGEPALLRFLASGPEACKLIGRTCGEQAAAATAWLHEALAGKLALLFGAAHDSVVDSALESDDGCNFALQCLHNDFAVEVCFADQNTPRYGLTFRAVVQGLCERIMDNDSETSKLADMEWLQRLMQLAPRLEYEDLLPQLEQMCLKWCEVAATSPDGTEGCKTRLDALMLMLQKVVVARPASRTQLLQFCLKLAVHSNGVLRTQAINFVRQRLLDEQLSQKQIEDFALEQLRKLLDTEVVEKEEHLEQYFLLFCALCTKNNGLLRDLVLLYPELSEPVQLALNAELPKLLLAIDPASPEICELIRDFLVLFPDPAKPAPMALVLLMLEQLVGKAEAEVPQALIDAVLELHSTCDDPKLMAIIFPFLSKEDAFYQLPAIMALPSKEMEQSFRLLLAQSNVSPADLLLELHNLKLERLDRLGDEKLRLRKVIEATSFCFSSKQQFTSEVFAVVIQKLVDQSPLPTLFMRTVIQAVTNFPSLGEFVTGILRSLVTKQIWLVEQSQWIGFVKCCEAEALGEKAVPVLLQLPQPQFFEIWNGSRVEAIGEKVKINEVLKAHVRNFASKSSHQVASEIMSIIKSK